MELGRVAIVSVCVVIRGCSPACVLNILSREYGNFRSSGRSGGHLNILSREYGNFRNSGRSGGHLNKVLVDGMSNYKVELFQTCYSPKFVEINAILLSSGNTLFFKLCFYFIFNSLFFL